MRASGSALVRHFLRTTRGCPVGHDSPPLVQQRRRCGRASLYSGGACWSVFRCSRTRDHRWAVSLWVRLALRPTISAEARSTADGATHATRQRTNGDGIDCGAGFARASPLPPGGAFQARENTRSQRMASIIERRKHARSKHPAGRVSRHAQQRVDERVMDVMARRDAAAAQRRDSHADQPFPARRLASARP
jgi:hypothetical protein